MRKTRLAPSKGRRVFLVCGVCFIVAGGILAWRLEPAPPPSVPPAYLAFSGRLVSRLERVGVADRRVTFHLADDPPAVVWGTQWRTVKTDAGGRFLVHDAGSLRGSVVHVFVATKDSDPWTFRPVKNLMLPAQQPVELTLIDGVTVVGRVTQRGDPVKGAPLSVSFTGPPWERLHEMRQTTTDERGAFAFHHLFEDAPLRVSSRVGGLGDHAVVESRLFHTGADGTTLDVGDLEVQAGCTLAGRVLFADRIWPHPKVVVGVSALDRGGSLSTTCDAGGRFEIAGVPHGMVTVTASVEVRPARQIPGTVMPAGQPAPVVAYQLAASNRCRNPRVTTQLEGEIIRDISDLTLLLEPVDPQDLVKPWPIDASLIARFEKARNGPIAGVPPARAPFQNLDPGPQAGVVR
jgi:hypothetical protein